MRVRMRVVIICLFHLLVMPVRVELSLFSASLLLHDYADFLTLLLTYNFLHLYQ